MDVTRTQAGVYVGAGAATATAFTALKHGVGPKALGLGLATGAAIGVTETLVQGATGSSELGWLAAATGGTAIGAGLLGMMAKDADMSIGKARGVGAIIGGATGILAPVVAGMVLAQLEPEPAAAPTA